MTLVGRPGPQLQAPDVPDVLDPRPLTPDTIVVLDFGAQYAQLIARRVREAKVRSLILPYDTPVDEIQALRPKGLILSGGPASVYEPGAPQCDPRIFDGRIPALGICYGMQLMAHELGGRTSAAGQREYGRTRLFVDDRADLFAGLEPRLMCWMSHGDSVVTLPAGFEALARTDHNAAAAALAYRAIRDQLTCIFVDHGLLRRGEPEQVIQTFRGSFQMPLVHVDARDRFLRRLAGIVEPEQKRRAIGEEFIAVFNEEARKLGRVDFLVQGTLYPDVIESGTRTAARIKTHHNVGGLPAHMQLHLIEPFRELFKDEVREVARQLDLPDEMVWRHPFPGPGLAIRVLGEVSADRLELARHADAVVLEELRTAGLMRKVWQAFAVLLPVYSVGVMGDARTYGHTVVVRVVTSEDGMTADWARLPDDLLERVANRITREVPGITRVAYDITSKPPATIEWE